MTDTKKIDVLLVFLVLLDIVLGITAGFFPDFWCRIFHGSEYLETYGLLKRTAGVWAAFTLFQFIAWRTWRVQPVWLLVVAGMRWSEIFSDWIYALSADQLTWFGWAGLLVSPPANVLFGLFLWRQGLARLQVKNA